jgi:acetaldehyde dehydrogenase/alcohol dehydrogenase
VIFRPAARAARCAQRAIEIVQAGGEAAGLPAHALQVMSDPTRVGSQHLFHHAGVDLIWTTGGQKAVEAAAKAGKPCIGVGAGNASVYLHRSADLRMAVVDILMSKTCQRAGKPAARRHLSLSARLPAHRRRLRALNLALRQVLR